MCRKIPKKIRAGRTFLARILVLLLQLFRRRRRGNANGGNTNAMTAMVAFFAFAFCQATKGSTSAPISYFRCGRDETAGASCKEPKSPLQPEILILMGQTPAWLEHEVSESKQDRKPLERHLLRRGRIQILPGRPRETYILPSRLSYYVVVRARMHHWVKDIYN